MGECAKRRGRSPAGEARHAALAAPAVRQAVGHVSGRAGEARRVDGSFAKQNGR